MTACLTAAPNSRQLKCLTVTDGFTKEGLGSTWRGAFVRPASSKSDRLVSKRGALTFLRSDNGPDFVSSAVVLDRRARYRHHVDQARQACQDLEIGAVPS
jgi:hypothetical protein